MTDKLLPSCPCGDRVESVWQHRHISLKNCSPDAAPGGFCVVFVGYAEAAEHRSRRQVAPEWSLRADNLYTC